jgi:hypothetical protein
MKILFEEYHYTKDRLGNILSHHFHSEVSTSNQKRKINYVGYYCAQGENNALEEPVMIFPKVFLKYDKKGKNPKAFGCFEPDEIIDVLGDEKLKHLGQESITCQLLYEMSVWLFRAIDKYRKDCENENISESGTVNPVISKKDNHSMTELEIIEALRLFYEENRNLFTFISRKSNSQKHRIKWSQTIARKTPLYVNERPVYFDVYSKKKTIDYDEELIRMFFSILNHLNGKYGFGFKMNINYDLIIGSEYQKLERKGYRYLKTIRHRYFNDKLLKLHELLSLYLKRISRSRVGKAEEEYLLIKDFNRVFEEMIDNLIGEKAEGEIKKMKSQPDNKQLDHIYREKGLFKKDEIYFIADSKYYSENSVVDTYSSYKQFTYARNVLALNLDIFKRVDGDNKLKYQDVLTDGYHPTPNFFISAFFDDKLKLTDPDLKKEEGDFVKRSSHWENRLFDRDTLFTLSYRINFMFVLQSFVRHNNYLVNSFKNDTRKRFRSAFIQFLDSKYNFYILTPKKSNFKESINKHFKLLLGISYGPSNDNLILAFEKEENGEDKLHRELCWPDIESKLKEDWNIHETTAKRYETENR